MAWPFAVRAQQADRVRRVGFLIGATANSGFASRLAAFERTFRQLGWIDGQNVKMDVRWGGNDSELLSKYSRELVRLKPDVLVVAPTNALVHLKKEVRGTPIIFVQVSDPMGRGIVDSLARPTGNITGFSNLEFSLIGKYIQIIKDIAPATSRVGVMISVSNAVSQNWFRMLDKLAPTLGVEPVAAPVRDLADIDRALASLGSRSNSALVVPGDTFVGRDHVRKRILDLAAQHRLPALYTRSEFVREGGLVSYGIDELEGYRGAASYVDRLLKGETPADLPVQQPTKFELVVSIKIARSLGLTVPPALQASADEVIE